MTRFSITLEQGVHFVLKCFERMQGGELFVPKIPSIRITELARVMAPKLPFKVVGIRPGEKVHEVMCPADDSHLTLEFADHFVIRPSMIFEVSYDENLLGEKGQPVAGDFQYSSDRNEDWLEGAALAKMILSTEIET
jgi:UDP-N-acetylglucosamine 4,6-dehydratase/5-epimerase